ncbi:NAD(P)-dependent oxidoreductase [Cryobacterium glaciale]|uniref:NAD(P)-dependent oxidoreductase n=1 Tax=Cryobacterium glaciale TaxID=1259145 RepID=A0A4V3I9G0_9MICO|nr:NAD(P)-dependent oxidoreductase [Cryobacterium glaciale]TFB75016.1 NAD(P)-dependent oxidoreductase [Cryobacterium glaciale]
MTELNRIGVLGLGRMGSVIAGHLVTAGFHVFGYDPAEVSHPLPGIIRCSSEAEVAESADVILVIVGFDEEVKNILFEERFFAALRSGHLIAILSTVQPATLNDIRATIPDHVGIVDSPVCRGQVAAEEGRLLALLGGADGDLERFTPVATAFCSDVIRVGGLGAAQVTKMANNVMLWAAYFGVFESMRLMNAAGVDVETAREALLTSSARSWALEMWPDVRPVWAQDDLAIAKQVAENLHVPVPVLESVADAFDIWQKPEEHFLREVAEERLPG